MLKKLLIQSSLLLAIYTGICGQAISLDTDSLRAPTKGVTQGPPSQQAAIAEKILNTTPTTLSKSSIIRDIEWQELECELLLKKLDRTQTPFGSWALRHLLHPVSDHDEIICRQTVIKTLTAPAQYAELQKLLVKIKEGANDILSYWDEKDALQKDSQMLYFSLFKSFYPKFADSLNRNRTALELSSQLEVVRRIGLILTQLSIEGLVLEGLDARLQQRKFSWWQGIRNGLLQRFICNSPYPEVYKDGYKANLWTSLWAKGTGGDFYIHLTQANGIPKSIALALTAIWALGSDLMFGYNLYTTTNELIVHYRTMALLQKRMMNIARVFKVIEQVYHYIDRYLPTFDPVHKQLLNLKHKQGALRVLITLLEGHTFDSPSGLIYWRGKVLLANQILQDIKQELVPVLQAIALIDAYGSIAKIMQEHANKPASFCFVELQQTDRPFVKCQDIWTPLMDARHIVLNSIAWGLDAQNKFILTGPNGSGKSTIMKAVAHTIMCAQAFGIAPAQKASLSVFTGVRSSLCPREDIQNNLSTFMAEKKRVDEIRSFLKESQAPRCNFILLDEPYRGTVESEAAYRIVLLGKELAAMPNTMMIMATHLEKPITLEKETGVFANYQLGIDEPTHGTFIRTFKLLPGPASWWFGDVERRARFVDQLLKEPQSIPAV